MNFDVAFQEVNSEFGVKMGEVVPSTYAVKYTPQTLTDEQKAQARANIGIESSGSGGTTIHRGEYNENESYSNGNIVSYKGSSYICTCDNTPTAPNDDGADWELLAEKGAKGDKGTDGKDYVLTDADMTEIASKVISALPVYDGSVV